jgi:hypothetical protein
MNIRDVSVTPSGITLEWYVKQLCKIIYLKIIIYDNKDIYVHYSKKNLRS